MSVTFEFDEKFYSEENRCSFKIPELMKRCWGSQLKVLEEFDKVCSKHSLKWFAFVGTLLGAVRHGGFIPWDDDIDIGMLREDYTKFLSVAPAELPKGFVITNYNEGNHNYDCLTRVTNSKNVLFDPARLSAFCDFPFPAGIDLYPLDYVVGDEEERKLHKEIHYKIHQATELCAKIISGAGPQKDQYGNHLEPSEMLAQISMMTGYEFDLEKDIVRQLNILLDMTDSINTYEESEYVANMGHLTFESERMMFPKECFDSLLCVPFETGKIYIPVGYDRMLRQNFGKQYMTPINRPSHDYPYYSSQQQVVRDYISSHPGEIPDEWAEKYL